jgi:putative transposase
VINLEYKLYGSDAQYRLIDEAIRTAQFVRNSCIRFWMDHKPENKDGEKDKEAKPKGKFDISKYTTILRKDYAWCKKLNSTAVQSAGDRAWSSIARFYNNCKKGIRPVGYPKFKKNNRSVEYKQSGWKVDAKQKRITFTDGFGIGTLKLKGTWDLSLYSSDLIKRVRIVRRADGYYVQFCINVERHLDLEPTGKTLGLDVGLKSFYTDSNEKEEPNPKFLRKAEKKLRKIQRRVSRKEKGSNNRKKAVNRLGRVHLDVQRQRKDHAVKLARCVMMSNDLVAIEDLRVKNMVRNRKLSKSISDASWSQFKTWLEYFAKIFGKVLVAVNPAYTTQLCSSCGKIVKKDLKQREHICGCGLHLDRDHNAALNILKAGLRTVGHTVTIGETLETLVEMGEDQELRFGASVAETRIQLL